jgi:hypothetical protein
MRCQSNKLESNSFAGHSGIDPCAVGVLMKSGKRQFTRIRHPTLHAALSTTKCSDAEPVCSAVPKADAPTVRTAIFNHNRQSYHESDDDNDFEAEQEAEQAREQCRMFLQQSMRHYKAQNPGAAFDHFMQDEWPEDFKLMRMAEEKSPACGRSYGDWREKYAAALPAALGPAPEV